MLPSKLVLTCPPDRIRPVEYIRGRIVSELALLAGGAVVLHKSGDYSFVCFLCPFVASLRLDAQDEVADFDLLIGRHFRGLFAFQFSATHQSRIATFCNKPIASLIVA